MAKPYWERRNAAARAQGYRNYYDYRAHDNGRLAPSVPLLTGEQLSRSRGHRGQADLCRLISSGRAEIVSFFPLGERDAATGQYQQIEVFVLDWRGRERRFVLRQPRAAVLRRIRDLLLDSDALYLDSPSLDVFGKAGMAAAA